MRRLISILPSLLGRFRRSADRSARRTCLNLERLEDRLCPATDYWTGAGAAANLANPNDNWSDPLNWKGQVAPSAGDTLVFGTGTAAKVATNDFAPGTTFNAIQISGDGYVLQGNAVQLTGGVSNSFGIATLAFNITLGADQTFTDAAGSSLIVAGSVNNGGHLWTVNPNGGGTISFTGKTISGSGGLLVEGDGFSGKFFLQDSAPDSFTGTTTITDAAVIFLDGAQGHAIAGNLVIGDGPGPVENDVVHLAASNQIANTSAVTVYQDGLLDLNGYTDTIGPLTMTGGFVTTGTGTLTLNGNVQTLANSTNAVIEGNLALGTGPRTFTVAAGTATYGLDIRGTISGGPAAELVKAGAGAMDLAMDDTYSGSTLVSTGTLVASSTDALGLGGVTVRSGATLDDNDAGLNRLSVNGNLNNAGLVEFTGGGSGTLAVNGKYTQTGTGALDLELAGTTAFDRLAISGTAVLGGTIQVGLIGGFQPGGGNPFPILAFASSSGTFATVDLPHPNVLTLRYDPRDVTIVDNAAPVSGSSPATPPVSTDVWTGAGGNANWSNPLNWAAQVAPKASDALYFPVAAATLSTNDYSPGTTFASITIAGTGYTITGNSVNLQAGLADTAAGSNGIDLPFTLADTQTISTTAGSTLTINAAIGGGYDSNLTFAGSGTVVLAGTNSYLGYTTVAGGILALANADALTGAPATGGRGTTVDTGATLQLRAGATYALEPLSLNGTGVGGAGALESLTGNNAWVAPIKLNGDTTITCAAGATFTDNVVLENEGYLLTVNAVGNVHLGDTISGAGGLTKNGLGTLTLTGPGPNLYSGLTTINAGTLMLSKASAFEAVTGAGLTIEPGATLAGTGWINTSVTNAGLVSPAGADATGSLVIDGNYTQTATGTLDMELAGAQTLDQVMVSGRATLGGTLDVSLLNGFHPAPGLDLPIMTFGSSADPFATVDLPSPGNGVSLAADLDAHDLMIAALAALIG